MSKFSKKYVKYDNHGYYWDWDVIQKLPFVYTYLSYEDFLTQCLENQDEQAFYYKDKIIDFSNNGKTFSYVFFDERRTIFERKTYNSFLELVKEAKFNDKTLKEIWDELK